MEMCATANGWSTKIFSSTLPGTSILYCRITLLFLLPSQSPAGPLADFGKDEDDSVGVYKGLDSLKWYIDIGRKEEKKKAK